MSNVNKANFDLQETLTNMIPAMSPAFRAAFEIPFTDQYGDRIPQLTRDKISAIGLAMTNQNYEPQKNEFISEIINKIGLVLIDNADLTNPLNRFKRGRLEYGEDIEEVFVDIIQAESFESEANIASDPFVLWPHNVDVYYHRINRRDYYPITVRNNQIRTAFMNSGGFNRLIDYLVASIYNSANYDEWILFKQIFARYLNAPITPLKPGQITAVAEPIDEATGKEFYKTLKGVIYSLMFPTRGLNPAGVMQKQPRRDIEVFVRADLLPSLEVDVLAAAFNKEEINGSITITPIDNFGDANVTPNMAEVYAAVFDRDMIMAYDTWVDDTYSIFNPRGMYANTYYHKWQVLGASYFKNAAFLVSEDFATIPAVPNSALLDSYKVTHESVDVNMKEKLKK